MKAFDRLIRAGVPVWEAAEIIEWYKLQGDDNALEKYITEIEGRNRVPAIEPEPNREERGRLHCKGANKRAWTQLGRYIYRPCLARLLDGRLTKRERRLGRVSPAAGLDAAHNPGHLPGLLHRGRFCHRSPTRNIYPRPVRSRRLCVRGRFVGQLGFQRRSPIVLLGKE